MHCQNGHESLEDERQERTIGKKVIITRLREQRNCILKEPIWAVTWKDEGGQGWDCVNRYVKKAGEEEDWKKKTRDRGGWKRLSDEAVKKLQAAPHPWQREKEEEREVNIQRYTD